MGTSYTMVFAEFKDKITDPDLLLFSENLQHEIILSFMDKAIARCRRVVSGIVDLDNRDNLIAEFGEELPWEVIDIITEWMTVFWLQPYVNNIENLRNNLSTKDFSLFSPANLLEKIGSRYDIASRKARSLMNEYSYVISE